MASDANRTAKRAPALLLLVTSLRKFKLLMQAFKCVLNLTCKDKGEGLKWVSNLILSNGFLILVILAIKNFSN